MSSTLSRSHRRLELAIGLAPGARGAYAATIAVSSGRKLVQRVCRLFVMATNSTDTRDHVCWSFLLLGAAGLLAVPCEQAHAGLNSGPEYTTLQALYTSTNGAAWTNHTGWGIGDACAWHGINCDQDSTPTDNTSHVTAIGLSSNHLTGTIPALTALTQLYYLNFSINQLTGAIPELTGFTYLLYVDLFSNQLTGSFPALTGLANLQHIYAFDNQLTGSIPDLTGLTNLQELEVHSNHLTGVIPALTGLANLQYFNGDDNQLTGAIPTLIGLSSLADFEANNNQLTGSVPDLTGLTNLQSFDVGRNQLTGAIPTLTGLTKLFYFHVGANQLTGAVPTPPASLVDATLCPNLLDTTPQASIDPAWDTASGFAPWWANPFANNNCDDVFTDGFLG